MLFIVRERKREREKKREREHENNLINMIVQLVNVPNPKGRQIVASRSA